MDASYLGEDLIFVISQPRSGSTLLQRLLAGHPEVQTSAETWLMLLPAYGLRGAGLEADFRPAWASRAVREFLEYYADGVETHLDGVRAYARAIYGRVLEKHGRTRFLDKTPRYFLIVPELARLFPSARFILLWRNPLSVLASELDTYVRGDWPLLGNFRADLLDAPRLMLEARELLGERALELRYESLVQEPRDELVRICDYLGLDFRPSMLDYADRPAPRGVMNDPVGVHRHTRAETASLDKWRALGRDEQPLAFAASYLDALGADTLARMGYPRAGLDAALREESVLTHRRRLFPWSVAITPWRDWSLRQQTAAAWYFTAESRGVVPAALAVAALGWNRIAGRFWRIGGVTRGRPDACRPAATGGEAA
jgi:hypothetical protein